MRDLLILLWRLKEQGGKVIISYVTYIGPKYTPLVFKDEPNLPVKRRVRFQDWLELNDMRSYLIEISVTKTKMIIIAARKLNHLMLEYPIM